VTLEPFPGVGHPKDVVHDMALVIRGGRTYWYKSVRKGGRVTSEYRGGGEFAALAGRLEAIEHEERRTRACDDKARRARLEAEDRPIIEMFRAVEFVARATLESRGCYLHRGHEWRRRGTVGASTNTKPAAALEAPLPPPEISTKELWKRARKGDKTILPRLRALIDRNPDIFDGIGVMREAEESLAKMYSGGDLLRQEVLVREIRRVAGELAGEDASGRSGRVVEVTPRIVTERWQGRRGGAWQAYGSCWSSQSSRSEIRFYVPPPAPQEPQAHVQRAQPGRPWAGQRPQAGTGRPWGVCALTEMRAHHAGVSITAGRCGPRSPTRQAPQRAPTPCY
jgi:hypothetical protein